MTRFFGALAILALTALAGCATQGPVQLDRSYWEHKPQSVGVVIAVMPPAATLKMGNQGLLDVAINDAMADQLTKHLRSLSMDQFRESGQVIATFFTKQEVAAKVIPADLDLKALPKVQQEMDGFATRDYTGLKAKYGVDQLVVLEVQAAGTIRNYYGFIPTGAPQGYFSCRGSLIDLSNNKLLWTAVGVQTVPIEKPWDQPSDSYPNVTTAFYRALEGAKTMMVSNLLSTAPAPLTSAR